MKKTIENFELRINLYGVRVLIQARCKDTILYIQNNLCGINGDHDGDEHDLVINIAPILKPYENHKRKKILPYYGSGLYFKDNMLSYFGDNFSIDVEKNVNTIIVSVVKRMKWRQFIRKSSIMPRNFNVLQEIYRMGVEYPILALLNNKSSMTSIHASGVINENNEATLFLGLNGAGKSTILESFLKRGYRAIGENFILLKEGRAYSFPGLKKLSKVFDCDKHKVVGKVYGKAFLKQEYSNRKEGYPIKRVNVVSRAIDNTKISKISQKKGYWYLHSIGDYLKEYENYFYTAFIEDDYYQIRNRNYEILSNDAIFYIVEKHIRDDLNDSELL